MRLPGLPVAIALASIITIVPSGIGAQDLSVHGQVRPRSELRDQGGDSEREAFTSMRVRTDFLATMERGVSVFVQLQDVRIWGEESNTLGDFSADQLDLHQGYVRVAFGQDRQLTATIGRQETNLGGQRLVGAVGWTQQGRSFDGLRLSADEEWASVEVLAYKLREGALAGVSESDLLGLYGVLDLSELHQADLYVLHNGEAQPLDTDQTTFGARLHGAVDRFTYRGELSLQRGQRRGSDVSAFMMGARVGTAFHEGRGALAIWYDYLSGDDAPDDGEVRVFDTLFATNHKYYGFADLFLNIPVHTGGLGLQDAAIKGSYELSESTRLAADLHHFSTAKETSLGSATLGQEADLTLTYGFTNHLGVTAGHSVVFGADALREIGRGDGTLHFGYLMLNATF